MSSVELARIGGLDRVLDGLTGTAELAAELFAIADLLTAQPPLRNGLADPSRGETARRALAQQLLQAKVSASALTVVLAAVSAKWSGPSGLVAAIERQGVRAVLRDAQKSGRLDVLEAELFSFARLVANNPGLRDALDNRTVPVAPRQAVVGDLLAGKADSDVVLLAQRAVATATHSYDLQISSYLRLAAAERDRTIARVTVAQPMPTEQEERLRAALAEQLGARVNLQVVIDPTVLGGARVRIGDDVIEGTVAARLASAQKQLS